MQDEKIVQSRPDSTRSPNDVQPSEGNTQTTRRVFLKTATIGAAAVTANALIPGALVKNAAAVEVSPFVRRPQRLQKDSAQNTSAALELFPKGSELQLHSAVTNLGLHLVHRG